MAFALYEMKIVMATIVSQRTLRKADPAPSRVRARTFTFAPECGVRVTVGAP